MRRRRAVVVSGHAVFTAREPVDCLQSIFLGVHGWWQSVTRQSDHVQTLSLSPQ